MSASTRVLLLDADPALAELLEEWLASQGCKAVGEHPDVVVVDLPFPREHGLEVLKQVGDAHPDTPVVAMPKPLTRETFVAALRHAMDALQ